ncbi:MAG: hypothetical protein ABI305_11635, partial [Tepidiformaceae bacterium]
TAAASAVSPIASTSPTALATASPTNRPAATPTRAATATPTERPAETPTAVATPLTPTSVPATPTRSGPSAGVSGPIRVEVGQSGTFIDSSSPSVDVQQRAWSVTAPATVIDQSNAAAIVVKFPDAGCYYISLSVSFKNQPSAFSASQPVAVGANTFCQ